MVIDTSALMAILQDEAERPAFHQAIEADDVRLVSAMSKLEAGMVAISRRGEVGAADLDRLLARYGVVIAPFENHHADIARDAFVRFGKGRHRAGLNFGDCAAYALAIAEGQPLLFKGTDFGATDVAVVHAA